MLGFYFGILNIFRFTTSVLYANHNKEQENIFKPLKKVLKYTTWTELVQKLWHAAFINWSTQPRYEFNLADG